jgi:hypothetical protein
LELKLNKKLRQLRKKRIMAKRPLMIRSGKLYPPKAFPSVSSTERLLLKAV